METITFITSVVPGQSLLDLYLLTMSIRDFGGELADAPIWVCLPNNFEEPPDQVRDYFKALDVGMMYFQADETVQTFPFGIRVQAAAVAEKALSGKSKLLAWLDSDTIVLNEPAELLLSPEKVLGYRPVHHRLLGTAWGEELDPFWELVYLKCWASYDPNEFMITHTGEKIRPYFNAGSFVVRPEAGLLNLWWQVFQGQYHSPDFLPFYETNTLYPIFMHQVILTGILLGATDRPGRQEFSAEINYPLHLHREIPQHLQASNINDLVTVRSERIFDQPGWQKDLPIHEPLLSWITSQLRKKSRLGAST
jgi:hypothetical protein